VTAFNILILVPLGLQLNLDGNFWNLFALRRVYTLQVVQVSDGPSRRGSRSLLQHQLRPPNRYSGGAKRRKPKKDLGGGRLSVGTDGKTGELAFIIGD